MKVRELKLLLEDVDDDRIVIIQKDGEGNGYSPLELIDDESNYLADSTWSGEVKYPKLTPELKKQGYGEEDCGEGEPALILVPIN
jgi:hypothetical protein